MIVVLAESSVHSKGMKICYLHPYTETYLLLQSLEPHKADEFESLTEYE